MIDLGGRIIFPKKNPFFDTLFRIYAIAPTDFVLLQRKFIYALPYFIVSRTFTYMTYSIQFSAEPEWIQDTAVKLAPTFAISNEYDYKQHTSAHSVSIWY